MPKSKARPRAKLRGARSPENPFLDLLAVIGPEISRRLERVFRTRQKVASGYGPELGAMIGAVSELCGRGGKRLRPALLFVGCRAASARFDADLAFDAGVALELLQAYFLIHDDWMDGDTVRRGGPAVHALLRRHFGDRHQGDASAILAGDYAAALALSTLSEAKLPLGASARVFGSFARMQHDAVLGQHLDLCAAGDPEAVYALKTGSYTVHGPLELGAELAGAKPEAKKALARYAKPLGIAFQLRDDLLGAFGEPLRTGKPLGSDLRAGKRTLLLVEALSRLSRAERSRVTAVFGNQKATEREVRRALDAIDASGARARVEQRIDELTREARAALGRGLTADGVSLLGGAIDALTARGN